MKSISPILTLVMVATWYDLAGAQGSDAGKEVATSLEAEPLLDLDMRLGEGTGALLAVPIIHAALSLFGMASFSQAGGSGAPPIS